MMKYVVLIGDGMADYPLKELEGKTPLEAAKTPNMDLIAREGKCGMVQTIPQGMPPGSDVAAMSIFGYDPKKYYKGRGPFEAAAMGIELKDEDVAFRCNVVSIKNNKMEDFSAGHISSEEAHELMRFFDEKLGNEKISFHGGVSYRNLCLIKGGPEKADCTPPHDISGKTIREHLPKGEGADLLNELMGQSYFLLRDHPVNKKRRAKGKNTADMIWLWGQGKRPELSPFKEKYGVTGAVITAVGLLKGIGKVIGLEVIDVPGATGYLDTNYKGKAEYALKALEKHDFVLVHVEAPDEAGHNGDLKGKIQAIEDFDEKVVGTILAGLKGKDFRLLVMPDHPTPITLKTHVADAVPFAIYGGEVKGGKVKAFNEKSFKGAELRVDDGSKLLGLIF